MLRPKAPGSPAEGWPLLSPTLCRAGFERRLGKADLHCQAPSAGQARPWGHHANSPRLPLGGQWGHDALPRQPHQLRLLEGVNANLSGKFKDFCKDSQ